MTSIIDREKLIIYGITMEEIDAPVCEEEEKEAQPAEIFENYTKIPRKFLPKTWPQSSNLRCHHCDDIPADYPRFIPINPQFVDGIPTADVFGHYCDWQCAAAGVLANFPEHQHYDLLSTICVFAAHMDKKPIEPCIAPAESRTTMMPWTGNDGLTRTQWRAKNRAKKVANNYRAAMK